MSTFGNIITVSFTDLTRSDDGAAVMSRANYDKLNLRNRINVVRRGGGMDCGAEVEWATLPERFKERYIAKYGDPEKEAERQRHMIQFDEDARRFFASYRLPDGSSLKEDKQQEYLINASVLNRLRSMVELQQRQRKQKGNRTPVSWDGIFSMSEDLRDTYGHTLPKSEARLRDKMREYEREGYGCLVSGKLMNTNTTKITAEAGRWIIAHKVSLNPVYNVQQLFDEFNSVAHEHGWKPLKSIQTLRAYLDRPEVKQLWYGAEQGSQRANNLFNRQFRTILPEVRNSLWYFDGSKINLYYRFFDEKSRETKAGSTNCIYVVDAYSEVFIGFYICKSETLLSTYEAIRSAAEFTGCLPYELVTDNQSGFTSKAALRWRAKLGCISHTTMPEHGQSKTIEAMFGRFQADFLHRFFNYTGGNITAKSNRTKIDTKRILANIQNLPDYGEMLQQHAQCVQDWNNAPHPRIHGKTRMQVYMESVNPQEIVLDETVKEKLFYIATEKASTFRANGIEVTIGGQKYAFEPKLADGTPDYGWRRDNTGREFIVEYDPHDLRRVRLYTEDSQHNLQFSAWAETYGTIHRDIMSQVSGERQQITDGITANKREIVRRDLEVRRLQMEFNVGPESLGYVAPLPTGVSKNEYLRIAEQLEAEDRGADEAAEVIGGSLGQYQKRLSNYDDIALLDRL